MPLSSVPHMPSGWEPFIAYLVEQREEAQKRHEHWQTLSGYPFLFFYCFLHWMCLVSSLRHYYAYLRDGRSLLRQLQSYLPSVEEIRSSFVNTAKAPVLVHSDLNDENLLGEWEDDSDEDEEGEEEEEVVRFLEALAMNFFIS